MFDNFDDAIMMITNPNVELQELLGIADDSSMLVVMKSLGETAPIWPDVSLVIAGLTTAYAHMHLYEQLQTLEDQQILYFDTDSIIWSWREGQPRLELSDFVRQFKDEIVDEYGLGARITMFFANALKSYGYVVQLPDGSVKTCSKLKGITQNVNCLNQFSLQDMLDAIVACSGKEFVITEPRKIAR
ncbi:hypothetical protein, partial [Pseudoalteromonas sp.]|uniref:hypothetical protein n=1 Tax=Pseudoalteromonas sp. TaxID=53249 RepID=UPI00261B7B54